MHSNTRQAVRVDAFGLREMVLGKSRQAHQRTIMHSNTRQAANNHALEHSTGSERVDAFGLREMVLGKSRQAHQRTAGSPANAKLTFRYPSSLINHSTLLLERSSAKLLVFYASTRSRRAVEAIICMITRDFSVISIDVTGVSLSLSLYYSQKSLTHNIGNASAFPIILSNCFDWQILLLQLLVIFNQAVGITNIHPSTFEHVFNHNWVNDLQFLTRTLKSKTCLKIKARCLRLTNTRPIRSARSLNISVFPHHQR